ncbi:MAG TPA: carbamoyltransferase C-terminal domain-containing protein [Acidobacteriota bacterium]|nr:carbamoyltransferase C-terminal domain-containing protein [Acidobacteriota bacterium]
MYVMGITGSFDRVDEVVLTNSGVHDSSVSLIKDGEIVAAIEEERFIRYKHSGKLPLESIRYCLQAAGIDLSQLDKVVFNVLEKDIDESLEIAYKQKVLGGYWTARQFIQRILRREFGFTFDTRRMEFIDHHYAHAVSAFYPSGFEESLVVTLDGVGAGLSGSVWMGKGNELRHIRNYKGRAHATTQSLGHFYAAVTGYLGFKHFDEYKVMGLAPYGDPSRFRSLFQQFYSLGEEGDYEIYLSKLDLLKQELGPARRKDEPVRQAHQDVAAALQETLELLCFHVLEHFQKETGSRRLCLAGGVAHNCAMNGKLLSRGLFDEAFVQPASHDGGLSLGAAMHGYYCDGSNSTPKRHVMTHALLGPDCGDNDAIERELDLWTDYLEYEKSDDIAESAAELISQGIILGWVQGRSEFGPRALGNRSIIADPRPAENKDIINAMIKKREAFRPFAPSVLEEEADVYFDLPPHQKAFPYMVFVVKVREPYRDLLGAITHVNGSARIQTVSRDSNPKYWALIDAFRRRTGIPIVLNTSFNNNAEPIVNTVREAVSCYITTGLNGLVIGDFVIRKKQPELASYANLHLSLPSFVQIHRRDIRGPLTVAASNNGEPFFKELFRNLYPADRDLEFCLGNTHDHRKAEISSAMASMLARADGHLTLGELIQGQDASEQERLIEEAIDLWGRRVVRLQPEV